LLYLFVLYEGSFKVLYVYKIVKCILMACFG
jgi:hypothetical protein